MNFFLDHQDQGSNVPTAKDVRDAGRACHLFFFSFLTIHLRLRKTKIMQGRSKLARASSQSDSQTVRQPAREEVYYHHIASESEFTLYINGIPQGEIKNINDPFTWDAKKGKIMLGLGYIGFMDELAIFKKSLDVSEVKAVYQLKNGIKDLID